ncbi:MAG: hypothetical protein P5702_06360 [Limnospira sp. PMC 1291.21]|uniref:Uncharacterized protein n=3 Tax=Limnospira TaxID=2596745 RepID=A0A9P1KIJ7_9CYAN|nr:MULTISPECIES: hypothetical protein [Limnospira]EKD07510.1 hypothetical protein SPLC1_S411770 [Arthrospira platensis C1]MDC0840310.1 hypothetical protein [Limnoraphis robusta]MDY7053498.1 hypothetical protein [Limnospira fusiformis LS22]QJB25822.1 hypothetical protein HFV01_08445 [Limnospira fusiformis SAG 85.79]EDZ92246.1 hypothetical protein AmaxDRAFT_4985 [Limnospira maxima CS-328]
MSLIHLEKSVLTFHFKEMIEDGHGNHPLTWVGLGVLVLGPKLLPAITKISQTNTKTVSKPRLSSSRRREIPLSQWIAEAKERELSNSIYKPMITPSSEAFNHGNAHELSVLN